MPMRKAYMTSVKPGVLIHCTYLFFRSDQYPLVLVTDVMPDRIRGINLHYLTLKFVKGILLNYCGKGSFSYANIKNNQYIRDSFRTFKRTGIRNLQVLDCDYINNLLQNQRRSYKYNPQELKALKEQIKQQLERAANPRAEELSGKYINMLNNQGGFTQPFKQDARFAFQPNQPTQGP